MVCTPENFFEFLDQQVAKEVSTEIRLKGYRIKVDYESVTETEMSRKMESIASIIHKSNKRK